MSTNVNISFSPHEPNIATVGPLVLTILAPYSEQYVTMVINPNIAHYIEGQKGPNVQISQFVYQESSDETIHTRLDLITNPEVSFSYSGRNYKIRLMSISTKSRDEEKFPSFEFFVEDTDLSQFQKEGSIVFTVNHSDPDWLKNSKEYQFKPIAKEGIYVQAAKSPERILRLVVNGPLGHMFAFREDMASLGTQKLHVAITWKGGILTLYLNAKPVKEIRL